MEDIILFFNFRVVARFIDMKVSWHDFYAILMQTNSRNVLQMFKNSKPIITI